MTGKVQNHFKSVNWAVFKFYRPQRSCGQGNIFTPVCHSVHRTGGVGGGIPQGTEADPPPGPGTHPPWTRHTTPFPPDKTPPRPGTPPPNQTPPRTRHPARKQTLAYSLRVAGTHPTGMHSCYSNYRPPWRAGNAFSSVCCPWEQGRGPRDHYQCCIGPYCTETSPGMGPRYTGSSPSAPNMFKLVNLGPHYSPPPPKHVHYEARTVSKRAVRILLYAFGVATDVRRSKIILQGILLYCSYDSPIAVFVLLNITIFYRFLLIIGGGHEWESASLQQIHAYDTRGKQLEHMGLSRRRNSWLSTVSFLIWLWTVGQLYLYLWWKTLHKTRRGMGPKQLLAIGLGTEDLGKAKSYTADWRLFSHKLLVISGIRLLIWGNQWRSEANKSHLSLASICAQTEWNCLGENHRLH